METRFAYFAGLFDGEGTFSIQVNRREYKGRPSAHFNPRMSMSLKYGTEVLDELAKEFGGAVYDYPNERKWCVSRLPLLKAATKKLMPYLKIKKRIAERFSEALDIFPDTKRDGRHLRGERSWGEVAVLRVAQIALTLNPYKKSPKTLRFLKRLQAAYGGA